jgi:hypothetical protein
MSRIGRRIGKGFAILGLVVVVTAALAGIVMFLWNALLPGLFHLPQLAFWQALGLLLLCRLLFGGMRVRGGGGRWRHHYWRERWEQMTPEERARLRARFAGRCGSAAPDTGASGG